MSTAKLADDKPGTPAALTEKGSRLREAFESISNDLADVQARGLDKEKL